MIIAYTYSDENELDKIEIDPGESIPKDTVWLDLLEPTVEEEKFLEKSFKIDIPNREELNKLEVVSPFYKEGDAYYMAVTAINKMDRDFPEGTAIIFILVQNKLVSLRYSRPKAFSYFSSRAVRNPDLCSNAENAFEGIVESLIHTLADALEKTGNEIDQLIVDILERPTDLSEHEPKKKKKRDYDDEEIPENTSQYYKYLIKKVGLAGNLISKVRESLVSINRMLIFFGQIDESKFALKKDQKTRFRNLAREVHSITEYANFLSQRNNFLLDAALGLINVEQNMIIKLFTVAAAMFFPPTLVASVYGMNFKYMPEIDWLFGYPFALLLIILSAVLPYYFFKKRGLL